MIDIDETIDELKHISGSNGRCITDAIKVCKMWRRLQKMVEEKDFGVPHFLMRLSAIVECLEEEFFPLRITRTLTAKFTILPYLAPCDLNEITKVLESVSDVKVKEIKYEKDC